MIFKVNIDKLFGELEEKQEVHEPTSKETEKSHGGDEASKEIKDSS